MNEQNTNLIEVNKTNDCEVKPTAMELILERALANDIDINRLGKLLQLRDKEIERQECQNFVCDLFAMQMEHQKIHKNATNTHTKSSYTTLDKYIDAIKEPLAKYNFALFSRIKEQSSNSITVEMTLKHISGNEISTQGTFPVDTMGSKNNIQAIGSIISYARRYLLSMLLDVVGEDDDIDGNMPIKSAFPQQLNEIRRLIAQTQTEEAKILDYIKVKNLDDMSEGQAQTVLNFLKQRQNIQKEKAKQSLPAPEQTKTSIQGAKYRATPHEQETAV